MSLKEFLDACATKGALVEVNSDGEVIAIFTVGSINAILTTIQNRTVANFTALPQKITVSLT